MIRQQEAVIRTQEGTVRLPNAPLLPPNPRALRPKSRCRLPNGWWLVPTVVWLPQNLPPLAPNARFYGQHCPALRQNLHLDLRNRRCVCPQERWCKHHRKLSEQKQRFRASGTVWIAEHRSACGGTIPIRAEQCSALRPWRNDPVGQASSLS